MGGHPVTITTQLPGCPWCGYGNAVSSTASPVTPKDGDAAVCVSCGAVAIFTDDVGGRRRATPEETSEILAMPAAQEGKRRVQGFIAEMKAKAIHVGVGMPAVCAACDELWPCSGSSDG